MPAHVALPDRKHDSPTFSTLPREIRDRIYTHLLVDSAPIRFFDLAYGFDPPSEDVKHALQHINLSSEARDIFYHYNTFYVCDIGLQAFLQYKPSTNLEGIKGDSAPKDHVRRLNIMIDPLLRHQYDAVPALRILLECPNLRKVHIDLGGRIEGMRDFDSTFFRIADVCIELFDKLGEEGLKVEARTLYQSCMWTLAVFKSGKPPQGYW